MELCLSDFEERFIDQYLKQELTIEELNKGIGRKLNFDQTDKLLGFYIDNKDHVNFWRTLWIMPKSYSSNDKLKIFTKYLLDNRHEEHEEMIGVLFDYSEIKENINLLKALIQNIPQYFYDSEREYVFVKKCFTILKKYKFSETMIAIESIFRDSDDDTIKKMAKYILDNNK